MPYRHELRVAFDHVDAAGIVYFARVLDFCHLAYEGFLEAIGWPLPEILQSGWGAPIVHADIDYVRPLRHGERIAIEAHVERIGRTSMAMAYRVLGPDGDDDVRARARIVHASVAMQDGALRSAPPPAAFLAALERASAQDDSHEEARPA